MCGICGLAGHVNRDVVARMTARLAHRGPDDHGLFVDEQAGIGLGHRRLSIIDLSAAGHQPMFNDDRSLALVFNGEIYNFRALREELIGRGHQFRSASDSEVILRLYEAEGVSAIDRLNGIFAFALWDAGRETLVLARDHLGVKPLYYTTRGDTLAFASEAKSLFEVPGIDAELNRDALPLFLTFLWTPDPLTAFTGVLKLPAGHYAEWKRGTLTLTRYWDLSFPDEGHAFAASETELVDEFRQRFGDAVERQLVSDVPVGAFLSAGLDSNSIVAAMVSRTSVPARTYTIAFHPRHRAGDLTLDDPAVAARAAAHYGTTHTEIVVDPDVADLLPRLAYHMDEPTADPALIMAYLVSREAKPEVTVLLSGLGGDELLGGYRKYVAADAARRYQRLPRLLRERLLDPLFRHAPARPGTPWAGRGRLLRKWGRSASLPPRAQFVANATYLDSTGRDRLLAPDVRAHLHGESVTRFHDAAFARVATSDFLNQMLYVDTKIFLASLNLTYNDKMSMASGVEVRVPFLDRELVDWVARSVPPTLKIKDGQTKYLLRNAFGPLMPSEVLHQPKSGFGAPIGRWLAHDLKDMVGDLLHVDRVRRRGLFDPAAVARIVAEQRHGSIERAWNVWQLLTLEVWMQAFIDQPVAAGARV
jgi:asparagine synthase (glutamine-hydrolysing)